MDAILFSAKPSVVDMNDAISHLRNHDELYFEVKFDIDKSQFSFPLLGFIHISGDKVRYRATIKDIVLFSKEHYEKADFAELVKPRKWRDEWKDNINNIRYDSWKHALIITEIDKFEYDTYSIKKYKGGVVKQPPQRYTRIILPGKTLPQTNGNGVPPQNGSPPQEQNNDGPIIKKRRKLIHERNLEDIIVERLGDIEEGLTLIDRQLNTDAGIIDILCKDKYGKIVVIELKRNKSEDQVVGQLSRYMGWAKKNYGTNDIRGIIIVRKKNKLLEYAVSSLSNVELKEFKISIV